MLRKIITFLLVTGVIAGALGLIFTEKERGKSILPEIVDLQVSSPVPLETWVWDAELIEDPLIMDQFKRFNIKKIYLNAGYEFINGKEKGEFYLQNHPEKYQAFIAKAEADGVKVEALFGNPDWALTKHLSDFQDQIGDILKFNQEEKARFSGIHLDIEPHLIIDWSEANQTEQDRLLKEFTSNIQNVSNLIKKHNQQYNDHLTLSLDLPPFLLEQILYSSHVSLIDSIDHITLMSYYQQVDNLNVMSLPLMGKLKIPANIALEFQVLADPSVQSVSIGLYDQAYVRSYIKGISPSLLKKSNSMAVHSFTSFYDWNRRMAEGEGG